MTNNKLIGLSIFTIFFCLGCKGPSAEQVERTHRVHGDTMHVHSSLLSKLFIEAVEEESFSREIVVAGVVQGIPTQLAYIAPPFSGRVTKSYIQLGQKVKVNTPLFEIISSDFTNAQKEFYQAQSERNLARSDMRRKEDLLKS